MKRSKHNGFTLLETLLGLMISTLLAGLCVLILSLDASLIRLETHRQEQVAILQIRQILAMAETMEIQEGTLVYLFNHQQASLCFEKGRLVKKEGYEIFMEGVEDGHFEEANEHIYLEYTKKNQRFRFQIA